jgi:homogentisate 1,2-dioxygenase
MTTRYMSGFGNSFETEALAGALPIGRNSPQKCNYGLYAEQISGSAFTAPKSSNQRSWVYRIRPSVKHSGRYVKADKGQLRSAPAAREESQLPIGQLRWAPLPIPDAPLTFVSGLFTMTTAGDADTRAGMAAHMLLITRSMQREYFFNADGEMLVVAQEKSLRFCTEFGIIEIEPGEICIIPRGVIFRVELMNGPARSLRPIAGRSAPTASPMRAIFSRPSQPTKTRTKPRRSTPNGAETCSRRRSASRRSMSSPGTAITRLINTTCAGSQPSARSPSIIQIRRSSRC